MLTIRKVRKDELERFTGLEAEYRRMGDTHSGGGGRRCSWQSRKAANGAYCSCGGDQVLPVQAPRRAHRVDGVGAHGAAKAGRLQPPTHGTGGPQRKASRPHAPHRLDARRRRRSVRENQGGFQRLLRRHHRGARRSAARKCRVRTAGSRVPQLRSRWHLLRGHTDATLKPEHRLRDNGRALRRVSPSASATRSGSSRRLCSRTRHCCYGSSPAPFAQSRKGHQP